MKLTNLNANDDRRQPIMKQLLSLAQSLCVFFSFRFTLFYYIYVVSCFVSIDIIKYALAANCYVCLHCQNAHFSSVFFFFFFKIFVCVCVLVCSFLIYFVFSFTCECVLCAMFTGRVRNITKICHSTSLAIENLTTTKIAHNQHY